MAKYTIEEIENSGRRAEFMAFGWKRDGWIMPDGSGVVCRDFGQLVFFPGEISGTRCVAEDSTKNRTKGSASDMDGQSSRPS